MTASRRAPSSSSPTWASSPSSSRFHRYQGLRATGMGRELELTWPTHPVYPSYGYVVRRRELDTIVAANAARAGATILEGHEAVHPLIERGFVRGALACSDADGSTVDVRAEFTIVADGANSRFGRALGTYRTREWPYGTAIRTYWRSPEARRAVDRVGARRQGPQRQPDARLRLDLPGRRRHREHRRRPAVDVPRLQERQHHPPARRLRPPDRRPLGDRRRPSRGPAGQRADPDGRVGRAEGRADPPRRRRRRRQRQPVQRRGHRLRLRDRPPRRRRDPRGADRRRPDGPAALPEAAARTSTASTSRSPGCSPGSSAGRR